MAGNLKIACPKCKKALQVPEVLAGKRIRCPGCSENIAVPKPASAKPAAPAPAAAGKHDDEWGPAHAYGMLIEPDKPRCPFCASEVEEDQVVCLKCGYNLQTREKQGTRVLHPTTGGDYVLWLLPGILCVFVVLAAIGMIVILWLRQPSLGETLQEYFQDWLWGRVYGSLFMGFIIWFAGVFAYKRLIRNPHPPEIEKHAHKEHQDDDD